MGVRKTQGRSPHQNHSSRRHTPRNDEIAEVLVTGHESPAALQAVFQDLLIRGGVEASAFGGLDVVTERHEKSDC